MLPPVLKHLKRQFLRETYRLEYREIGVQLCCNFLLMAESGWYASIEFYKVKTDSIRVNLKNTGQTSKIDLDLYLLTYFSPSAITIICFIELLSTTFFNF